MVSGSDLECPGPCELPTTVIALNCKLTPAFQENSGDESLAESQLREEMSEVERFAAIERKTLTARDTSHATKVGYQAECVDIH